MPTFAQERENRVRRRARESTMTEVMTGTLIPLGQIPFEREREAGGILSIMNFRNGEEGRTKMASER